MSLTCTGCGNANAWHLRSYYDKRYGLQEICDACGLEGAGPGVPDVFFSGKSQKFENLCDDMGRPYEITSKRQKADVMKQLGVTEAGDRVNGAPYGTKNWTEGTRDARRKSFDKEKPAIREVYKRYLDNARKKS